VEACRVRLLFVGALVALPGAPGAADQPVPDTIAEARMAMMRQRALSIAIRGDEAAFPKKLEAEPLFRYDDLARGYVDGAVWRLGEHGRARAIITTELHPRYAGSPRIVYDFLSLSTVPFTARSADVPGWSPSASAVTMQPLPDAPAPAATANRRLFQMKRLADQFSASQTVEGEHLELRLLPRPIDRYAPPAGEPAAGQPGTDRAADGAMFLFVAGRMPGVLLLIETDGRTWQYGIGRLSHPSALVVSRDGNVVWEAAPALLEWNRPYTASNAPAVIPGFEP
jgi:hypothetical protein